MEEPPSPLHAAVQVADLIRTSIRRTSETGRTTNGGGGDGAAASPIALTDSMPSSWPPGLVDGIVAGGVVLAILTPFRSRLIQIAGTSLGMLPDLVLTSSQVVASGTAALYMGSLQGSRFYLKMMADADPNLDAWVPRVCSSREVQTLLNQARARHPNGVGMSGYSGTQTAVSELRDSYYFTQDPRRQTLDSLAKALETCRRGGYSPPSSVDFLDWPS